MNHTGFQERCWMVFNSPYGKVNTAQPDLIVSGGLVLTMVEGEAPLEEGDVLVAKGRIADIRKGEGRQGEYAPDVEIIDARETLVMPGLVNAHTHSAMTLFRGFADDLPLEQWLYEKIFPAESRFLSPETVYSGALLACLEMIASGTTCFSDGYFFQDKTMEAAHEAGLRGLVAQGVLDLPAPGVKDPGEALNHAREFMEKWQGVSDLLRPGIFCHSPLTCSAQTLKKAMDMSQRYGSPLQIHLSETAGEVEEILKRSGKRPARYLSDLGVLKEGLIAVHAVHMDDEELAFLKEKGIRVVHVPESNMKLCAGMARVTRMADMGIPLALGTDGCASNNNLDLFQEMDTAAKLSKVADLDPVALDAKRVLEMATIGGAEVLDLGEEIGTLEKGKRADMIIIDLHSPHLCPLYDPLSALVYAASGADVRDVIVDGRVLMRDRAFTTLDPGDIMEEMKVLGRKIHQAWT